MRYDREWFLQAVRVRLDRAVTADGGVDADVVFGPFADAELRGLLRTCDVRTDMEARHTAGWLCAARAMAAPGAGGTVHGCMSGTLLYPVWVAEPGLVPPELAASYASNDPATHPDPADADGPDAWAAQVAAFEIVVQGRQHKPPPDASEDVRRLHEMAEVLAAMPFSPEVRLATAIGLGSLAVLATPEYDPWFPGRLRGVAALVTLTGAAWPFGDLADADPVRFVHGALKRIPAGSPERPRVLTGLSRRLLDRYVDAHDPEDLHEAVGIARDVVAQLPPGDPHLPHSFSALGTALMLLRQEEGATPEECDEAVDVCRRAVAGHPKGAAAAGHDLGTALVLRAHHTGRVADLDEAISVFTEALRVAGDPGETTALRNTLRNALGNALRARSVATGSQADLDAALGLTDHSQASASASASTAASTSTSTSASASASASASEDAGDGPQPPLIAPAMALYNRYLRDPTANGADLDEALRQLRHAEALMPPGHPTRPAALDDLGLVLVACYQRSGKPQQLNEAVLAHRESASLTREGHGSLGPRLLNLGAALNLRHLLTEDGDDLRESQECRRRAFELPGMGPAHRAALRSSAGLSLMTGFERAPDPVARLDEAVRLLREALALTPEGDPGLPRRRHNLAVALMTRISKTMRIDEAREARELADAVIAALPPDSPDLPRALTVAAGARRASLRALLSSAARDEVVALYRRAVETTPPGHPTRTQRLSNLGGALRDLGPRRRRRPADLVEAAERFQEAALEQQCAPVLRLDAARSWGEVRAELGDWGGALDGYVVAVDLLHSVAPRHLVRDDQEFLLSRTVGLGAAAAACAVRCGRPGLAVKLLEQARGVILSHAFDADSDLTRLRESAPGLADRFEELREALDTATGSQSFLAEEPSGPADTPADTPADAPAPADARADVRQRLAAEWHDLTARIHAEHPELGLLRPLRDWDEDELRATAAAGPVVLVNVSPYGSDALIVTEHSIDAVPLPGLDPRTTATRRQTFQNALIRIATPGTSRKQSQRAQQDVRETLAWLWQAVTGPVLDHLPAATRVWWSPGGLLGTLPLHAAAPADTAPGALDRVVSSYTPTLRALHHARLRAARPTGTGTLVVSVAQATGQPPLPGARGEAEHLARLLPRATLLADASATHSAVVSALPRHAYAHFACHALGDLERASGSRLVLHDHTEHPLTVRDLARLRLPSVRLAYLSACDTLRTSPELADEAVHIVSAFQMAGFPHVVGSLWHVDDEIGAEVALSVYATLHRGDGTLDVARTAEALHHAVRTLRDTYPRTPSLWACQVHAGP
ncbi:CHAT domain-containing protein [Streptomyces kunmingensis]|uniref:CHAT domain-containing protein n=1 Tax=Streptomyces kunmingensis TaxID=68225 RepID=A0ABU6CJD4_9ACTN|nr:CHAT domain-containing protein [Streptomyces kunmingensis]MEB3964825.1 CHAT domain-containing protein [Streptomyces kunmingensis]